MDTVEHVQGQLISLDVVIVDAGMPAIVIALKETVVVAAVFHLQPK